MGIKRTFKRKAEREQKAKLSKAQRRYLKMKAAIEQRRGSYREMVDHWLKIVERLVPFWMQILSLYIPPEWYSRFWEIVIVHMVNNRMYVLAKITRIVTLLPLYTLKKWIRYFGVTTKLEQIEKGKWIQTIRHFGRMVDRSKWTVR